MPGWPAVSVAPCKVVLLVTYASAVHGKHIRATSALNLATCRPLLHEVKLQPATARGIWIQHLSALQKGPGATAIDSHLNGW